MGKRFFFMDNFHGHVVKNRVAENSPTIRKRGYFTLIELLVRITC